MDLSSRVRIGVSLNNVTGITGKTYELTDLIAAGVEAEAMGFDLVWVHDAPLGRRTTAAYDPTVVLAHLAGATRNVLLGSGILMPHVRNPVLLAQQWATLHLASRGRAVMGVGTGAGAPTLLKREYEALAALRHDTVLDPQRIYEKRGRLFEETMEIIRRLWSEDKISYAGEFFRFDDVTLGNARPSSPPPVLMGAGIYFPSKPGAPVHHGWQEKFAGKYVFGPFKRIVDHADGWLALHLDPAEYVKKWTRIMAYAAQTSPGKDLTKGFNCFVNVNESRVVARDAVKKHLADFHGPPVWDDVVDRWAVVGPPEEVARTLQGYIDVGVTVFQLVIGSPDQLGQMKRIADEVLPRLER
jgi:alkanesulfonate monooxygenase SsuD/methylene tetrahydromethanopterin reductase-like flavin-dependent oxidoreductase (luciferase family)